ncbi:MAG: alpha/beta hydrolase [Gemmatimonadetes bacterium]|nr:alpha/beta hydrolase [Gemmatimonadota bacterium]
MPLSRNFIEKWITRRRQAPGTLEILPEVSAPQLGNRRDILVYTPASYHRTERRYPVIYMQDGQNLFDPRTSFAGEWGVDRAMARAPRKGRRAIIVGIPNMGVDRMKEYSPWHDPRHGGGGGDAYVDFIVHTLKPLIDARYRTAPDRESTGIVGSSLGALIALYGFFRAPASFGFVGAMSPAFWFADGGIFPFVQDAANVAGRVYLDVGMREGPGTLANARSMRDLLTAKGYPLGDTLSYVEDPQGVHNEAAWGRRIRHALPFLLTPPVGARR